MASIFRRSYWTTVDGQRVKKTIGTYYIKYIGADGKPKRVTGYKNKAKTQALAAKLEAEAACGPDPFDRHRRTPLAEHLKAYRAAPYCQERCCEARRANVFCHQQGSGRLRIQGLR